MPSGLALAIVVLVIAIVLSYMVSMILSLFVSPAHTKRKEMNEIVKKLDLKENDVFADLGSGDGRVVFAVAKHYKKTKCVGYEISPILLMISNLSRLLLYPFSNRVQIFAEDFTKANLDSVTVAYVNLGKNLSSSEEAFITLLKKQGVRIVLHR